ncbi:DUF3560 domain-containing protein [Paenibacillus alvei]|uniref:DUF3560 domain-containing protein n=1 Tax=Paenibacillus alvei TaxID=44250 RepID=UPI0002884062|nr:DUF3560 domain-containing protein [Paenibacillus alvei]EJW13790.1 hypothetical protein PAV_109p00200 [Paenibacillus alvei DSM 29]MCY9540522.1 DUF3560 domain-containing protein [Paenibacillus alvei]MCY9708274.1 DUF3560 domain-containing protein [Paenibacillus alvei]MCY9732931.1 DUF3560 domain-containing protein [Paenibacillus alvei]MCY9755195.1 DUF3560 domain-containing protein [Paenibacillus alvei]
MLTKQYILNNETSKIELQFSKQEYQSLTTDEQKAIRRAYLFSSSRSAWVSRSTRNHYSAILVAQQLGFTDGGKTGERLSYAEEVERQVEKAEARIVRYEKYADNAETRAKNLQKDLNSMRGDNSFFTQPIIAGHAGSQRFARQREKMFDRYHRGFEEYRKSEYFRDRAVTAQVSASMGKFKDRTYLSNRIEECNKNIREYQRRIVRAEENQNESYMETLLEKMEYELDKLAYLHNKLDEIGGVQFNKDNLKPGYLVRIRGSWDTVVKANSKMVEVKPDVVPYTLKYPYAEIQEMKIPEGWTEKEKGKIDNPFEVGDVVVRTAIWSNDIVKAYQVVKKTEKSVTIKEIYIQENIPQVDNFKIGIPERRAVKIDRNNNFVVNHDDWFLYKYNSAV